jgi:hypothetical protein
VLAGKLKGRESMGFSIAHRKLRREEREGEGEGKETTEC